MLYASIIAVIVCVYCLRATCRTLITPGCVWPILAPSITLLCPVGNFETAARGHYSYTNYHSICVYSFNRNGILCTIDTDSCCDILITFCLMYLYLTSLCVLYSDIFAVSDLIVVNCFNCDYNIYYCKIHIDLFWREDILRWIHYFHRYIGYNIYLND